MYNWGLARQRIAVTVECRAVGCKVSPGGYTVSHLSPGPHCHCRGAGLRFYGVCMHVHLRSPFQVHLVVSQLKRYLRCIPARSRLPKVDDLEYAVYTVCFFELENVPKPTQNTN